MPFSIFLAAMLLFRKGWRGEGEGGFWYIGRLGESVALFFFSFSVE